MGTIYFSSLKRAFVSKKYIISMTGIIIMCFISSKDYLKESNVDAAYIIELLINLSLFKKVIVFFSALPFVTIFCQDHKSKYINSIIVRSGKKAYIFSDIISCILTSFSSTFFGMSIFYFFVSYKFPSSIGTAHIYCDSDISNNILYMFIMISIFSVYCTVWSAAGLALSSLLPDKYIALGSPLIFGYLLEEITYRMPSFINLYKLSHCLKIINGSCFMNYIYTITVLFVFILLFSIVFSYFAERRIKNEMV